MEDKLHVRHIIVILNKNRSWNLELFAGARHPEQVRQRKRSAELPRVPADPAQEGAGGGPRDQLQGVLQGLQQGKHQAHHV
jgi:hypothetical protein